MNNIISFQAHVQRTSILYTRTIKEVYEMVKTGGHVGYDLINKTSLIQAESDHDKQNRLKKQLLPYCCFNGRFDHRADDAMVEYSCYSAIDFDGFSSEEELQQVKYWLTEVPFVQFVFRSPSGRGLKVIVAHTNTDPTRHRVLYHELLQVFNLPEVDTKTSDLSRATFICYDPDAWWNDNCIPYCFDASKYVGSNEQSTSTSKGNACSLHGDYESKVNYFNSLRCDVHDITDGSIKRIIASWLNKEQIGEGNRNNMVFRYACKLCNAGVHYDFAAQLLVDFFETCGLKKDETLNTVCNAYSKCCSSFGSERYKYGKKRK